jgi:hypothetical protein
MEIQLYYSTFIVTIFYISFKNGPCVHEFVIVSSKIASVTQIVREKQR